MSETIAQHHVVLPAAIRFLPLIAAAVEGFSIQGSGVIALAAIYFSQAPFGLRVGRSTDCNQVSSVSTILTPNFRCHASVQGFLNAVFVNITRRTEQQQFLAAILSGAPSIVADHNSGGTPQLKHTEENVTAWLTCRTVLLRSFLSVQKRTEAMAAFIFILCIGLFAAVAVPAFTSEERVPLHGNAFLILLAATLIILLGSFAVSMSVVGDKFNHLAAVHVRELAKVGIYGTPIKSTAVPNDQTGLGRRNLATSVLLAQELVRATQEVQPLSILGLIELNLGAAKAVLFFMTIDLGIVFSRIDWGA